MAGLPSRNQKQIPLAEWRRFVRVADWWDRTYGHLPPNVLPKDKHVIFVKNATGSDKRRGEVVALNRTPLLTELVADPVIITGEVPTSAPTMPQLFAVLLESCLRNDTARAQIAGVCPALVYVNAVTDHFCDLPAGEDRFVSNETGPVHIVQQPASTGEQTCLVNLSYQEESHLVGVPVGNGITARYFSTPGTGIVQLYRLIGSSLAAVIEGGQPVYLTVYSLADDPILPQANHTFPGVTGDLFYGHGTSEDYYLLHVDQWGVVWIEREAHTKIARYTADFSFYAGSSVIQPITSSGYTWAQTGGYVLNLDGAAGNEIFTALGVTLPADWAFATINRTSDYHLAYSWYGGSVSAAAMVYHWLEYQQGGAGAWAVLFPTLDPYLPFSGLAGGVHKATPADGTGSSSTTIVRLNKGTRIRGQISVTGGPTLSSPIRSCLTAIATT